MLLKDKVVLITGSNRGIGRGVVEEFAAQGKTSGTTGFIVWIYVYGMAALL